MDLVYENSFFEIEQIDRAIFEAIRLELVLRGHLPNKTALTQPQYATAKQAIASSNIPLIEVFGVGGYEAKGELKYNHIILDRIAEFEGELRGSKVVDYIETAPNELQKNKLPISAYNINYSITIVTQTVQNERLISQIIRKVIPTEGPFFGLNADRSYTQKKITIARGLTVNLTLEPPYIEKQFGVTVRNVFLDEKVFIENVVPITEIDITTELISE